MKTVAICVFLIYSFTPGEGTGVVERGSGLLIRRFFAPGMTSTADEIASATSEGVIFRSAFAENLNLLFRVSGKYLRPAYKYLRYGFFYRCQE